MSEVGNADVANECQDAPNPQLIPSTGGTFDSTPSSNRSLYVGSCAGNGPEKVFVLEVVESRLFRIRTTGSGESTDTVLYIRAECDLSSSEAAL